MFILSVLLKLIGILATTVNWNLASQLYNNHNPTASQSYQKQNSQDHHRSVAHVSKTILLSYPNELANISSAYYKHFLRDKRTPKTADQLINATDDSANDTETTTPIPVYFPTFQIPEDSKLEEMKELGLFMPNRPIPPRPLEKGLPSTDPKYDYDCLVDQRTRVRDYPNKCYKPISRRSGIGLDTIRRSETEDAFSFYDYLGPVNATKIIDFHLTPVKIRKKKDIFDKMAAFVAELEGKKEEETELRARKKEAAMNSSSTYIYLTPEEIRDKRFQERLAELSPADRKKITDKIAKDQKDEAARKKDSWDHVWQEIRNDFAYTFDFVLWDGEFKHRKEIQFWYLMLYLKSLVIYIPSPKNIVQNRQLSEDLFHRAKRLENLLSKKKTIENKTRRLEAWIARITSAMQRFEYDKNILLQQMDAISVNMALYEGEKSVMDEKLVDIEEQTEYITSLINRYLPIVHHINTVPQWKPNPPVQQAKNIHFGQNIINANNEK